MSGKYASAIVLGLGCSGRAAARLLLSEGASVTVVDRDDSDALRKEARHLEKEGAVVWPACEELPQRKFDVAVVSPGVRTDSDWIRSLKKRRVPLLAEVELGASRSRCPILAVTGANGKSSFLKLCGEMLMAAHCRIALAGNYGPPLSGAVEGSHNLDWLLVEISSFQLETTVAFHPRVGVLLNVQADHLDRHGNMRTYRRLKSKLFDRMQPEDVGIVLDTDLSVTASLSKGKNEWRSFGSTSEADYRYEDGVIRCRGRDKDGARTGGAEIVVEGTLFANEVMGRMAAAAVAVRDACGLDEQAVNKALRAYKSLPHRLNKVMEKGGIQFVDDSKATNMAALEAALIMSEGRVRLIAGGRLKEKKITFVKEILAKKAKTIYLIGEASETLARAWKTVAPCRVCGTLANAVSEAWNDAEPGDVILLSPGCASFDQFKDFEERGRQFAQIADGMIR